MRLLDRTPNGAEPTPYGKALLRRARAVFDELRGGVEDLAALADPNAAVLRIGTNEVTASGIVAATVANLSLRYPRLRFVTERGGVHLRLDLLRERRVDLFVTRPLASEADTDIAQEVLYHDELIIVCGAESPLAGRRRLGMADLADEAWIVGTVKKFADRAGIGMPEVGIFEGEPNAFATGAFKNSALVAVSTGLLQNMTRDEVEAVIGHEVAHIANGDMVTMTLIQGVMNTFVVFLSRVIGYAVDSFLRRGSDSQGPGIGYMVTTIVMDIVLGFLAAIIVAWFSRQREFRADAGAADLMGRKQPMINALARLGGLTPGELPKTMQALGITGGLGKLFSTHPPIEERIAALQQSA